LLKSFTKKYFYSQHQLNVNSSMWHSIISAKFCSYQEVWQTPHRRSAIRKCSSLRGSQCAKDL